MTKPSLTAPFAHTSQLSKGGRTFTYVPVGEVIERLNAVLGYGQWSYECELVHLDADFVVVKGRLSALGAVYEQFGGQKINKTKAGEPIDLGDDLKGAASDAAKKAAQMIGVGLYLAIDRGPTPFSSDGTRAQATPEDAPSAVPPSPADGAPISTSANQGETTPQAVVAASDNDARAGGDPAGGGGEAPPASGQSDDPAEMLKKVARTKLLDRVNALPLERKAEAIAYKRQLKLQNWFTASDEVIAQMAEKVAELETVSA